jgi:hypothetical protein
VAVGQLQDDVGAEAQDGARVRALVVQQGVAFVGASATLEDTAWALR